MKTGSIEQSVLFNTSASALYDFFMDAEKHSAFTNSEVSMLDKTGEAFSVFDGYCSGVNLELERGKKIVQSWNFAEEGWPDDHYSICTFTFEEVPEGCLLHFLQTEIPEHKVEDLKKGWVEYYWNPIKLSIGS